MANFITRDKHNLQRNLNLNSNYISNDGGNEGISIDDDGEITISSALKIKELSSTPSAGGVDTYGHLWVKNTDPTQLWFTNDDGDDIQMTSAGLLHTSSGVAADNISVGDAQVNIATSSGDIVFKSNNSSGTEEWLRFKTDSASGGVSSGTIDGGNVPVSEILAPSNQRLRIRTQGQGQGLQLLSGQNIQLGVYNSDFDATTSGGAVKQWKRTDPFNYTASVDHTSGLSDGSTTNVKHVQHSDDNGKIAIGMRCKGRGLPEQALGEEITHIDSIASDECFRIDTDPDETGSFSWVFMSGLYMYPKTYYGNLSGTWTDTAGWIDIYQELDQDSTSIPAQLRGSTSGTRSVALVRTTSNQPKVHSHPVQPGSGFTNSFSFTCSYNHTTGLNEDGSGGDSNDEDKSLIYHADDDGKIKLFMSVYGTGIPIGAYVGEVDGSDPTQWFRIHLGGGTGLVVPDDRVAVTQTFTGATLTFYDKVVFKDPSADAWITTEAFETGDGYIFFGNQDEDAFASGSMVTHGYMDSNNTSNWNFSSVKRIVLKSDSYFDNTVQIDADEIYLSGTHHEGITGKDHTDVFVGQQLYICNQDCNQPKIRLYYDPEDESKRFQLGATHTDKTTMVGGFVITCDDDTSETLIVTEKSASAANNTSHLTIKPEGNLILEPAGHDSFGSVIVQKDITETDAGTYTALSVDYEKTNTSTANNTLNGVLIDMDNVAATNGTNTMYGIYCTPTLTHAAAAGTPTVYGGKFIATGAANGTSTAIGLDLQATGADTNIQLKLSANAADYATLHCADTGDLTIATVGDGTTDSDLILDADGDIELDAAGGDIALNATNVKITHADEPQLTIKDTTNNYEFALKQNDQHAQIIFDDHEDQDLQFISNDGVVMRINGSTGKIGMGYPDSPTLPSAYLEIRAEDALSPQLRLRYAQTGSLASFHVLESGDLNIYTSISGDITLDAVEDIILDADGGNITLQDGGSTYNPTANSDAATKAYVDTGDGIQYHFIRVGFNSTGSAKTFLPMPGAESLREGTVLLGLSETYSFICPYDGNLEQVQARSEEDCGSTIIGLHHSDTTLEAPSTTAVATVTVDMAVDDTTYLFDFDISNNDFSKGDIIAFSFDPTNTPNDVHFMITLKFDTKT